MNRYEREQNFKKLIEKDKLSWFQRRRLIKKFRKFETWRETKERE